MSPPPSIALVGMGISGLTALRQLLLQISPGVITSVDIYERTERLGGALQHVSQGEFLCEQGAQTLRLGGDSPVARSLAQLLTSLTLDSQILPVPRAAKKRYLLTPRGFFRLGFCALFRSSCLGFYGVLRLLCEPFIPRRSSSRSHEETVFAFFARRFGRRVARALATPLCFGIWAGGVQKIKMKYAFPLLQTWEQQKGSVLRGFFSTRLTKKSPSSRASLRVVSLRGGMSVLPHAIYRDIEEICRAKNIHLQIFWNHEVEKIARDPLGIHLSFQNKTSATRTSSSVLYRSVIYAGQPWRSPSFVIEGDADLSASVEHVRRIPSHGVVVVSLGGISPAPPPQGFGALAGEWSHDLLGVIFVHALGSASCPEGRFFYRLMLGGDRGSSILQSESEILRLSKQHLVTHGLLPAQGVHFECEQVVFWPHYIPLYDEHADGVKSAVWNMEAHLPGLFFVGNYMAGVSVADCVHYALQVGDNILKFLDKQAF